MKYSVIIPTYNRFDLIKKCVDSILKYSSDLLKSEMEVIIVSNGCKDGTPLYLETLATHNKAFKYIVWEESLGYSKAIKYCLNRFDADTSATFYDLYTKVDGGADENTINKQPEPTVEPPSMDEQPF